MDQRTQQQYSQKQIIDTRRSVDTYLMDKFRQPGKSSEGFGIGSSCGVSKKGAFSENLFGEVEDSRIADSDSIGKIPGYGEEVKTGTEIEFTEEICDQVNQDISRTALSEYENNGLRKIPTEMKVVERRVESCGPDEHHAMEEDYILSPDSEEPSEEKSDDDYLSEDISDTDFSNVGVDVNEARSETSFAGSLDSVACGNVTQIASIKNVTQFWRWCQS